MQNKNLQGHEMAQLCPNSVFKGAWWEDSWRGCAWLGIWQSIILNKRWKDLVARSVWGLQEMGKIALFVIFIGDIIICFMLCGRRARAIIYWSFSFMKFSNGWSGVFLTERLWFLNTSNKVVMSFPSPTFYCFLSLCWYYFSPLSPPPLQLTFYFIFFL